MFTHFFVIFFFSLLARFPVPDVQKLPQHDSHYHVSLWRLHLLSQISLTFFSRCNWCVSMAKEEIWKKRQLSPYLNINEKEVRTRRWTWEASGGPGSKEQFRWPKSSSSFHHKGFSTLLQSHVIVTCSAEKRSTWETFSYIYIFFIYMHTCTHMYMGMYTETHTEWSKKEKKLGLLISTHYLLKIAVFVLELMIYCSFDTAGTASKLYTQGTRSHTHTYIYTGMHTWSLFVLPEERA